MRKKSFKFILIATVILGSVLFISSSFINDVNAQNRGITNAIPALYDGSSYRIIFVEFPAQAEKSLIARNPSVNFIYQCDAFPDFISVLDAIPGDGMNAVWVEVQIVFNTAPHQFNSDTEILDAAAAGEITLITTDEAYVCPVIGKKP